MLIAVTEGPEARMVATNAAVRNVNGNRTAYGLTVREGYPDLAGQGISERYEETARTGVPSTLEGMRSQIDQGDGTVVETYLDLHFVPRLGPDGTTRGTICIGVDVTERLRRNRAAEQELEALRAEYEHARVAVRAMQRVLLPDSLPVLGRFDVAAHYVLASGDAAAGGDWFDTVVRPDGRLVLVVGDVVGHGTRASAAMGQLRSVLLAELRAGSSLTAALTAVDRFATTVPDARRATVCVVEIDPASGALTYCTAGHPPPLVVTDEEATTRFLAPSGSGPLATGSTYEPAIGVLGPGQALLLYSDGILERPHTTPVEATVELRDAARRALVNDVLSEGAPAAAVDRLCTLPIELLTRLTGFDDDITLLAAQRREPLGHLAVELDADTTAAPRARAHVRTWLAQTHAGAQSLGIVDHVITELVDNAADHAYPDGEGAGTVAITAHLGDEGTLTLTVEDRGTWRRPVLAGSRGRGLAIVRQLVDDVELSTDDGTRVTVQVRPTRPARLLEVDVRPAPTERGHSDIWSSSGGAPRITVVGPLDRRTVAGFLAHGHLAITESRGSVTIDLDQVTILASAGVDAMYTLRDAAGAAGLELELEARRGSPASQIMVLTGLA